MIGLLKKYFVPHENNGHVPHILRDKVAVAIAGFVFVLEAFILLQAFVILPGSSFLAQILPSVLVADANSERAKENSAPLRVDPVLTKAATAKASDMASKGYFAHVSPDGKDPWYWIDAAGYRFEYAGENLAVNFFDSHDVAAAWMRSKLHRENILNAHFTDVGIGMAQGLYKGRSAVFVVQMFASPAADASFAVGAPALSSQNPRPGPVESKGVAGAVLGASAGASAVSDVPSLSRFLASPREMTFVLYGALLAAVLFALLLKMLLAHQPHHAGFVMNGIVLVLIIAAVFYVNIGIANSHVLIE